MKNVKVEILIPKDREIVRKRIAELKAESDYKYIDTLEKRLILAEEIERRLMEFEK